MGNASIRVKMLLSLSGLVAGCVFLAGMVLWNTSVTAGHIDRSSKEFFPAALSSQEAETEFQKATKHYQDAVVLQDLRALIAADKDMGDVLNSLSAFKQQTAQNPTRQDQISRLSVTLLQLRSRAQLVYPAMIANPETPSEQTQQAVAQLAADIRELAAGLTGLRTDAVSDFNVELQSMSRWSGRDRLISFGSLVVVAVWVFAAVFLLQKQIIRPIEKLSVRLRNIAEGDGDLTKRLGVDGADELGQVASSFNLFMDRLQTVMREVAAGTIHLAGSATEISTTAVQTAHRADSQQQEAEQIAIAMAEMAGSVADVSRSSHSAAEKARHAVALANEGGTAVQEAISRMRVVTGSVEEAGVQITELGLRSKQIGLIVGLIGDITTQTNLLALNAAIEAARAGEHGRGFAVVAGEVRSLAERTAQATNQIGDMIALLQSGTDAAVQTMRHSTAQVQLGMEAATLTGDSLRRIIEAVEQGADMITRVAGATTQQAIGTDGVNENIGRIATLTRESAIGAKRSADAVADIATLAVKLEQMISTFRLEEDAGEEPTLSTPWRSPLQVHV